MSDSIKVAIKVRPLIKREKDDNLTIQWTVQGNSIVSTDSEMKKRGDGGFCFDHIFDMNIRNLHVFDTIVRPIVDAAVNGFNGTVFAYGQTSSGKTHTMMGTSEEPGIVPLAIEHIFDAISDSVGREFLLRVSYLEIYNERVNDLLNKANTDIKLKEDTTGQVILQCKEEITNCPENVLTIMKKGDKNRRIGETNMNERSSRSHTIFRITIESRQAEADSDGAIQVSQLNLVDLAGSERARQTGATGERFKEGRHINLSLSTLGLVIMQLSESQDGQKHVNFRDSKLTRLLQNSLGGNAMTAIICAVTPAALEETQCTLSFASRAKSVKNKPQVNEVMSDATLLKRYAKQLSKLQAELEKVKNENRVAEVEEMESKLQEKDRINQLLEERIELLKTRIVSGDNTHQEESFKCKAKRRQTWGGPGMFNQHLPFLQPKVGLPTIKEASSEKPHRKSLIQSADIINQTFQTAFTDFELELFESERVREITENVSDSDEELFITKRKHRVTFRDDVLTIKSRNNSLDSTRTSEKSNASTQTTSQQVSPSTPKHVLRRCIVDLTREFVELREFTTLEKQMICKESRCCSRDEEDLNLIQLEDFEEAIDKNQCTKQSGQENIARTPEYTPEVRERLKNLNLTEEQNVERVVTALCMKLNDAEKENSLEKSANQRTKKQFSELEKQVANITSERNEFEYISQQLRAELKKKTTELELKNMSEESIKQVELKRISELEERIKNIISEKNEFERLYTELRNESTKKITELQKHAENITSERAEFEHIRRELYAELNKKSVELDKLKNDPEGTNAEFMENITELKAQIESITSEKNKIEDANKELESKISVEEQAKKEAVEKVSQLEEQLEQFRTEKIEFERVNVELNSQLNQKTVDLESKVLAEQAEKQKAMERISELEKQIDIVTSDKNQFERINNELKTELNQKTTDFESNILLEQVEKKKAMEKVSQLEEQIETTISEKNEFERVNTELKAELNGKTTDFESKILLQQAEKEKAIEKVSELEKQIENIISIKNEFERVNTELKAELNGKTTDFESKILSEQAEKEKAMEKISELENHIENIISDRNEFEYVTNELKAELNKKATDFESKILLQQAEKEKVMEKVSELEKEIENIVSDKNEFERVNIELCQKTSKLEKQIEQIVTDKNELERINIELQAQLNQNTIDFDSKIQSEQAANHKAMEKVSELEEEIKNIISDKNEFERINIELCQKTSELEKQIEQIVTDKNELDRINIELQAQLNQNTINIDSKIQSEQAANQKAMEKISELEEEIKNIMSDKNEFERVNIELCQKTSELEKQIEQIVTDKNELERINIELQAQLNQNTIDFDSKIQSEQAANHKAMEKVSELEEEIKNIISDKNEFERVNVELCQKTSELEKQIEQIVTDKNELERINIELQAQLNQYTIDIDSKIQSEQAANQKAMEKISELEKEIENIVSDKNEFERVNIELCQKTSELEKQIEQIVTDKNELERINIELQAQLNQNTIDIDSKIQSEQAAKHKAMEKVSELEGEIKNIVSDKNEFERVNIELCQKTSELEKQIEQIVTDKNELERINIELQARLNQNTIDFDSKIQSEQAANQAAMERISESEKRIETVVSDKNEFERINNESYQKTSELEKQMEQIVSNKNEVDRINNELYQKTSELEKQMEQIVSEKNELECTNAELKVESSKISSDLEAKIKSDETENNEAMEKIVELEKQIEQITAAKNECERVNVELKETTADFESKLVSEQASKQEAVAKISELEKQIEEIVLIKNELNQKTIDYESRISSEQAANQEAMERISAMEKEIENITAVKEEFERVNTELQAELDEKVDELQAKLKLGDAANQLEITQLEEQIHEIISERDEFERINTELQSRLAQEAGDLESKITSDETASQIAMEQISALEKQIQEMASDKNEFERIIGELKSELNQKTTDLELKISLEQTTKQEAMEKISELEKQIENLILERNELERIRGELAAELNDKSLELEESKSASQSRDAETMEKISKLKEQMENITSEKIRLEKTNAELESKILSEETEKLQATEQLSELQNRIEGMVSSKLELERINAELQAQLNQKTSEQTARQGAMERISELEKQIEAIAAEKNDSEKVACELRDELTRKSVELENKNDDVEENSKLKECMRGLQEMIANMQTENQELKEQLDDQSILSYSRFNESVADTSTLIVNMEAEKSQLEENLQVKSQELDGIKSDVRSLKTDIENLQKTIYLLTNENMEMATKLNTEQENSKEAQMSLQKTIDELYVRISDVTNEKISLESDLATLKDQLESMKSKLPVVHSEEQQFANYQSKIDKLTAENIELSASIAEKNKELDSIKESKSLLFDHECMYKEKIAALTETNGYLSTENNELSTDLMDKIEEIEMLKEQCDSLKTKIEQSKAMNESFTENDSDHLKSENNILRAEIAELKSKVTVLSEENAKFSNNLLETMENLDCSRNNEKVLRLSNKFNNSSGAKENDTLQEESREALMNKVTLLQEKADHLSRLNKKLSDLKLTSCSQCAHLRNLNDSRRALKLETKVLNQKLEDLQRRFDRKCADTEILKNKMNQEMNLSVRDSPNVSFVDEMNVSFVEERVRCLNDELQTLKADHEKLSALYEDRCHELEQLQNGLIADAKTVNGSTPRKSSVKNGNRIEQVQSHIDKLRNDIDSLKKNSTSFTGMLNQFKSEKTGWLEEVNALKSTNEELQRRVSERDAAASERVQMLENELKNMSRGIEKFSIREKEFESQKVILEVELEGLKLEEQKKNALIGQLNERVSALQNELQSIASQQNQLAVSNAMENRYREEIEKERMKRKEMEHQAIMRIKELEANIERLQIHIEKQECLCRELQEKGLHVQSLYQESEQAKYALTQRLQSFEAEFVEAKNNLEMRYREEFNSVSLQCENRVKESENNLQKLNDTINKYVDENLNLMHELGRLRDIEKQFNERTAENDKEKIRDELNDIKKCMIKELRSLKCNINFAELSHKSVNEILMMLLQTLVSKEAEIMKSMKGSLEKEKRKLEDEKQQSADRERRVTIWAKELEAEVEKLQSELTEREHAQKENQNKISQLEHLLRENMHAKEMLKGKVEELEMDMNNLQAEFDKQCKVDNRQDEAVFVAQRREKEVQETFKNKEMELLSKMKSEKETYEKKINELQYTIESYKTKNLELNGTIEGLEANDKQLKNIIEANSMEMKKNEQNLQRLTAELEQFTEAYKEMSQELEQKSSHIDEITAVLKSKCDTLSEYKTKLETIVPEYEMLKEHIKDQKRSIEMYKEETERLKTEREKQLEVIKDKLNSEEIKNAGLNKQLHELNNRNVALVDELNELKEKYEELQQANAKLERKVRNSTSKIKAENEIEELKELNKRLQSNLEGASNKVAELQDIKNQTLKELVDLKGKHELLVQQNAEAKKMLLSNSKQSVSMQDDRYDGLLQEKNKIALELEGKKLLLNQKEKELKEYAGQMQRLKDENKELDSELDSYAAVIQERDNEISKLEEKLYSRLTESTVINELEEKLKTQKAENEKLRDKADALQMRLQVHMEQTEDTKSQNDKLIRALKKQNMELQAMMNGDENGMQMDRSRNSYRQLQNTLDSSSNRVAELQEERNRAVRELADLKHTYDLVSRESMEVRKAFMEEKNLLLNQKDKESREYLNKLQELTTKNKELDDQLEKYRSMIRERDVDISNLQSRPANSGNDLVNNLMEKLKACKEENRKLRNEIGELQMRSRIDVSSERVSLRDDSQRKQLRPVTDKEISKYEEKCQQLKNKIHELELQLVSKNGKIATLEIQIQSENFPYQRKCKELEELLLAFRGKNAELSSEVRKLQRTMNDVNAWECDICRRWRVNRKDQACQTIPNNAIRFCSTNSGVVEDHVKIQKLEKEKMLMKDLCRARSRRIKELEDRLKELEEPQSLLASKPNLTS